MSTYTLAKGSATGGYPALTGGIYKVQFELDVAAEIAAGNITTQIAQNDVIEAIRVPANTLVVAVGYQVTTALTASGTTTMEVGDGTDTDGYIAAASVMSASTTQVNSAIAAITVASPSTLPNSSEAYTFGKFYSAADTIDLKFPAASNTTVGVIKVYAVLVDCNLV